MKKISKKPPLRWHIVCLGRTIAKFEKRGDASASVDVFGGPICCKIRYVKRGAR